MKTHVLVCLLQVMNFSVIHYHYHFNNNDSSSSSNMNVMKHDYTEDSHKRRLVSVEVGGPLYEIIRTYIRYDHPHGNDKEVFIKWLQYCPNREFRDWADCMWRNYWPNDQKTDTFWSRLLSYQFAMRRSGLFGGEYSGA